VSALGLVSEKQGIIPNRDWKLAQRGVVWTPGETVVAGIGQGFVLTTPLQLALMTARIANGKSAIIPSLVAENDPQLASAFAPYKNPRYAISVVVEHGGSGSSAAAPIASDILDFMLASDGVSA
jgi:penicillin-binding protein 2